MTIECPKCQHENPDETAFCGKCGTKFDAEVGTTKTIETPTEELTTGSTFAGRYQIIEELGKGGMGRIYKVLDKETKEKIALKLIKPEIGADKKTIERFKNELTTARKIGHRNVCRMYDLNKEKDNYYITMEFVSGGDLKRLIRRVGQLPIGKAISIAKQICDGLEEAHSLGIVHRDLKPNNIMIDDNGNARIMDFGIARTLKEKGFTGSGVMIGTPEYMSPEQAEAKEVDQRSDIYSLGIILYEMVTGQLPFEGDSPFTIGIKHKSETPKDPQELNVQIPEDFSRVILKCLEKNLESRYQSAEEVLIELNNIEKKIPTKVVPEKEPITSKEITVSFRSKKLLIPALAIVVVAITAIVIWQLQPLGEKVSSELSKPSIAVLPFEDLSPQKDQGYLCDGLAESLINVLTKIKDLRIPARTSSFSFREKERNIKEIGQELDVETVLEGSIQKSGNRVRITVKLVNVLDNSLLWSEQYNQEMNDIFAIQDKISLAIVNTLKVSLLGEEKSNLTKRYTESVEAYNLYLQGRFFWNKRTEEGLNMAKNYFEKTIAADPTFALGYVGLADVFNMLGSYSISPQNEVSPKAREAALKALEIDNTLSEAYTSLAWIKMEYDWDWEGAEKEFKSAIELNPGYTTAHIWYSWMLLKLKRYDETIEEIRIALELDPLSPVARDVLAMAYYLTGQEDLAIDVCKKSIEFDPNFPNAHHTLAKIYLRKSMFEEAISEFQIAIDVSNRNIIWYLGDLGYTFGILGKKDEALRILEELQTRSKEQYVPKYAMALIYFGIGEKEKSFSYMERALEKKSIQIQELVLDPLFSTFRQYPEFESILEKMNLNVPL